MHWGKENFAASFCTREDFFRKSPTMSSALRHSFDMCSPNHLCGLFPGDALFALRASLNASSNQLIDWNQNQVNPCTWSKVICDNSNNVITV